jgi:AcrR family transcriptional regulator
MDTRQRIVQESMRLFAEQGFTATSVAEILVSADVNSGSLYYAFPGKTAVLVGVLDAYLAALEPVLLEPVYRKVKDPIERVFALLASYRARLKMTDCHYGCPIGSLALELHDPDPAVRERLAANFNGWITAVEECFVAAGNQLPKDLDRHALAVFTLTTMEGGVMLSRTFRSLAPFDASVRMLRAYIDALLLPSRR